MPVVQRRAGDGIHFTIPSFAQELVLDVVDTWGNWFEHPFMQALFRGTLEEERVIYALQQEQLLWHGHLETASLLLTRKQELEEWDLFQQGLHWIRGQIELEDETTLLAPETLAYRNFLFVTAYREDALTGLMVWLVHPWLRAEVAHFVARRMPEVNEEHPFFTWLSAGRQKTLTVFLDAIMHRLEHWAKEETKPSPELKELFARSVCYEWRFLEQAWQQLKWNCPD